MKKHAEAVKTAFHMTDTERNDELRARLINEECKETLAALGFVVDKRGAVRKSGDKMTDAAIVKECCDIHVVTTGTMISLGLTPEDICVCQKIVDENNLLKIDTSPGKDAFGKILKADDHPSAVPIIFDYLEEIAAIREQEAEDVVLDAPELDALHLDGTELGASGGVDLPSEPEYADAPITDQESGIGVAGTTLPVKEADAEAGFAV